MAYMAVGSRQILFSDSPAPALPRESTADVASMQDNSSSEQTEKIESSTHKKVNDPAAPPGPGANLDLLA
ncbi:MAG: hypothetical protein OEZ34_11085 [Spirochaetia bacterium]|nr:hypothetical protein [Spirochaetia bacterium]